MSQNFIDCTAKNGKGKKIKLKNQQKYLLPNYFLHIRIEFNQKDFHLKKIMIGKSH